MIFFTEITEEDEEAEENDVTAEPEETEQDDVNPLDLPYGNGPKRE